MRLRTLQPIQIVCILLSLIPIYIVGLYMYSYVSPIPIGDQWWVSLKLASALRNGTLQISDITATTPSGHRIVFTHLHTLLLTYLMGWQPQYEALINPLLALINLGVIAAIFHRYYPTLTHFALLIFALFIFSVNQEDNWLWSYNTCWHFVIFFILAAILTLIHFGVSWRPFLAALIFAFCATFALAQGMVAWGVLIPLLWLRGYRHLLYYMIWISIGALAVYLYVHNTGIGSEDTATDWLSYSTNLRLGISVALHLIGAPVGAYSYSGGFLLAFAGILILIMCLVYLWIYQPAHRELLGVWLALSGYAALTAMMIALTRLDSIEIRQLAMLQRYNGSAIWFWIAVAACLLLVLADVWANPQRKFIRGLVVTALVIMGVLYLQTNLHMLQQTSRRYGYTNLLGFRSTEIQTYTACMKNFPAQRDPTCLRPFMLGEATFDDLYKAATYRLLVYHDLAAINILPETYQAGSPILMSSPSPWLNLYMRETLLDGISEDTLLHLFPDPAVTIPTEYQRPLQRIYTDTTAATLSAIDEFTANREQIWYITTPETASIDTVIFAHLAANGYAATPVPIQQPAYQAAKFGVFRFQRPPDDLKTIFSFGEENIQLQSWTLDTAESIRPCENIRLQSWWQSKEVPKLNYSATLVLVSPDGNNLAQKDDAIGETLMQLWQPGQLYFDERILTLPCDLPSGDYTLHVAIYHHISETNTFERLPAFDPAGDPLGDQAYLTTITVAE